ncbi:Vacuolar protein 8 [Haplosporangium sp. Z 767]|nr:Vacuolar protein 8 [Haplosporangium sp. Z 11]KAF9178689.1 Vacuolar protein 8 [Haplosporangium sp. Z 767]
MSAQGQLLQPFRLKPRYGQPAPPVIMIESKPSRTTGQPVIFWSDIEKVFLDVKCVMQGNETVKLITDENYQYVWPPRILPEPRVIFDVVVKATEQETKGNKEPESKVDNPKSLRKNSRPSNDTDTGPTGQNSTLQDDVAEMEIPATSMTNDDHFLNMASILRQLKSESSKNRLRAAMMITKSNIRGTERIIDNFGTSVDQVLLFQSLGYTSSKVLTTFDASLQYTTIRHIASLTMTENGRNSVKTSVLIAPLIFFARSPDVALQQAATKGLSNLIVSKPDVDIAAKSGILQLFITFFNAADLGVRGNCVTGLKKVVRTLYDAKVNKGVDVRVFYALSAVLESPLQELRYQALDVLQRLVEGREFEIEISQPQNLAVLHRLLCEADQHIVQLSMDCIHALVMKPKHPTTRAMLLASRVPEQLAVLLSSPNYGAIQSSAVKIVHNLVDTQEGIQVTLKVGIPAALAKLQLKGDEALQITLDDIFMRLLKQTLQANDRIDPRYADGLRGQLLEAGILRSLIGLSVSLDYKVQLNSSLAIRNLSCEFADSRRFIDVWDTPEGGIQRFLAQSLESKDHFLEGIAASTITIFQQARDPAMRDFIACSDAIRQALEDMTARCEQAGMVMDVD